MFGIIGLIVGIVLIVVGLLQMRVWKWIMNGFKGITPVEGVVVVVIGLAIILL